MIRNPILAVLLGVVISVPTVAQTTELDFAGARQLLDQHCSSCHAGDAAVAGFNLDRFPDEASLLERPERWTSAARRIRDLEMPPRGVPAPEPDEREALSGWIETTLRNGACAAGLTPGPQLIRRLNKDEYAATIRDLLGVHFNAGAGLPADGAGGEGFDNAAETLFLSPMHAEKYLDAARQSLEYAFADPRSREVFLVEPSDDIDPADAARQTLSDFLPRAFRRPATDAEVDRYYDLYQQAVRDEEPHDQAVAYALQGALMAPQFLFRVEEPNETSEPRLLSDYEFASRLSYFLWGSMPDEELFEMAASGDLRDPTLRRFKTLCMLDDERAFQFAERFVEQWLGTRELGRDIRPDERLFPGYYDAELKSVIGYEPVLFFQEILAGGSSLLELIDSDWTFLNRTLVRHYNLRQIDDLRQNPRRVELPEGSRRGGLVSMAAVLAVSSYPHRTSPVLRGKWVLENLLGTPPPPPPPDVPELDEEHSVVNAATLRERLEQHRADAVCASCHDRIDPIGFGLENYDVLGRWRTSDKGSPIDARGQLPSGEAFEGPAELKQTLLDRKDLFIRNLVSKMLGYALGRGLTLSDQCTVDEIVAKLEQSGYNSHTLILEIVNSVPFRYQAGTNPDAAVAEAKP